MPKRCYDESDEACSDPACLLARYLNSCGHRSRYAGIKVLGPLMLQLAAASGNRSRGTSDIISRILARADPSFCVSVSVSASQARQVARVASYLRGLLSSSRSALWPLMTPDRIRSSEEGEAEGCKSLLS